MFRRTFTTSAASLAEPTLRITRLSTGGTLGALGARIVRPPSTGGAEPAARITRPNAAGGALSAPGARIARPPRVGSGPRPDRPPRPPREPGPKPSSSRFSSPRKDRNKGEDLSFGPPAPKVMAYTPAPVTIESLAPLVPATPLSAAGLSSALNRETEKIWGKGTDGWRLGMWARYDRLREEAAKAVVGGEYTAGEEKERGTVDGEAARLCARNGTVSTEAMGKILEVVAGRVGGLRLGAPKRRQEIEAGGVKEEKIEA